MFGSYAAADGIDRLTAARAGAMTGTEPSDALRVCDGGRK